MIPVLDSWILKRVLRYIKVVNKKCKGVKHETTPYTPEASVSHLSTQAKYVGHYLIGHLFSHNIFRSFKQA